MFGKEYITQLELDNLRQEWAKQLEDLQGTIGQLQQRVKQLEQEVATLKQQSVEQSASEQHTQRAVEQSLERPVEQNVRPARQMQTFYLPAPTVDGVFTEASRTEQMGTSIYQMTTDDGLSGRFIMLSSSDAIATAMISVSQFVKPACRIEGNTHVMPRRIETIEEGTVKKDGSVWRVQQKAIVMFS